MRPENEVINSLWIGDTLSNIELLTILTFLEQGHRFRLWVYGPIITPLPKSIELMDANQILPADKIFRYQHVNAFGHGKGSVSGFSDVFRYKLLYDQGGWWTDMDVSCLRPLNFEEPYVFRNHHTLSVVGNVMKCPKGSQLMLDCYNDASKKVTEENRDWHLPIQILNDHIAAHGLGHYVRKGISNLDRWDELRHYILSNQQPPENYYFIHWMNEEWRSRGLNKNQVKTKSFLGQLMIARKLIVAEERFWELVKEEIYYSKIATHLPWLKHRVAQSLHR